MNSKLLKEQSIRLIEEAIIALKAKGIKPSQRNISNESGLAIITVKRHWLLIKDIMALQKAIVEVPLKQPTNPKQVISKSFQRLKMRINN